MSASYSINRKARTVIALRQKQHRLIRTAFRDRMQARQ